MNVVIVWPEEDSDGENLETVFADCEATYPYPGIPMVRIGNLVGEHVCDISLYAVKSIRVEEDKK